MFSNKKRRPTRYERMTFSPFWSSALGEEISDLQQMSCLLLESAQGRPKQGWTSAASVFFHPSNELHLLIREHKTIGDVFWAEALSSCSCSFLQSGERSFRAASDVKSQEVWCSGLMVQVKAICLVWWILWCRNDGWLIFNSKFWWRDIWDLNIFCFFIKFIIYRFRLMPRCFGVSKALFVSKDKILCNTQDDDAIRA